MASRTGRFIALSAALMLGGCSFASDVLFPEDEEQAQAVEPAPDAAPQPAVETAAMEPAPGYETTASSPGLNTTNFVPPGVTPGEATGTHVGEKVDTLRGELTNLQGGLRDRNSQLQELRGATVLASRAYHGDVADINHRLQVGTTPGNPILTQKWNAAQAELSKIPENVTSMNQLATEVASDSAMAAYILDSVHAAYLLSGAVDEDHAQLRVLEDETNQTIVLIERLLNELNEDITRQQQYVSNELSNLNTLAMGIQDGSAFGVSLANRARAASAPQLASLTGGGSMAQAPNLMNRRPLVVIRFGDDHVNYENALYQAVNRALEQRPNAVFDLVAVAPSAGVAGRVALMGNEARRHASNVMRTLSNMGLPAERVVMSSTASPQARNPEVRVYIR